MRSQIPDGTFEQLTSVTNSALNIVIEHAIRIPQRCHNFFSRKFVTLVSLTKVPSGRLFRT